MFPQAEVLAELAVLGPALVDLVAELAVLVAVPAGSAVVLADLVAAWAVLVAALAESVVVLAAIIKYSSVMWRVVALLLTISSIACAENNQIDPGSFDVEPPLLIPNRDQTPQTESTSLNASPRAVDITKLEKQFERAKRNLAGLDRFLKIGALSKLEVEQRQLRVVHLEFELANARLVAAKEQMLQKDKQVSSGEIAKTDVTPTENNLALAITAAHTATAKREQADIDAAEANVRRQEKLLALGSARKKDLERAVEKLEQLRSQRN